MLIPASATSGDALRTLVFKTATSKFRIKKPTRIFAAGTGEEIVSDEDWERNLKNDVTLLVSAGEEYVGVRREAGGHGMQFLAHERDFRIRTYFRHLLASSLPFSTLISGTHALTPAQPMQTPNAPSTSLQIRPRWNQQP